MSNIGDVQVKAIKNPKGNLVGSGSCVVGGLVRINFTVIKGSKGLFASLPQRSYQDKQTGKTQYVNEVSLPDTNLYNEFQKAVVKAFEEASTAPAGEADQTTGDSIPF